MKLPVYGHEEHEQPTPFAEPVTIYQTVFMIIGEHLSEHPEFTVTGVTLYNEYNEATGIPSTFSRPAAISKYGIPVLAASVKVSLRAWRLPDEGPSEALHAVTEAVAKEPERWPVGAPELAATTELRSFKEVTAFTPPAAVAALTEGIEAERMRAADDPAFAVFTPMHPVIHALRDLRPGAGDLALDHAEHAPTLRPWSAVLDNRAGDLIAEVRRYLTGDRIVHRLEAALKAYDDQVGLGHGLEGTRPVTGGAS